MDSIQVLPDRQITEGSPIADEFVRLGVRSFHAACRHVHELPYGYNADRDNLLSLLRENRGTCTTKHAVIATLARELDLPVYKNLGAYAMTEDLVAGTDLLLHEFALPYIPMLHCFLASGKFRVDLTEGNRNGKKLSIEVYLKVWPVEPHISAKEEYLLLREALTESILQRPELRGVDLKKILQAREAGIKLLKANLQ